MSSNEAKKAPTDQHKVSTSELMASAQTLSGAAQSMLKHEAIDKKKVADAADNVLHAAKDYGKLDDKGYGSYIDKADTYLHSFKSEGGHSDTPGKEEEVKESAAKKEEVKESAAKKEESEDSGFGGVMKFASGFMK